MPPPASHSDATAPGPGEHRWFYRGPDGMCGPVSTERMLQDAQRGLLTPQSEVRLGLDGDWVRASTLEGLLPDSASDGGTQQPPNAGQQTVQQDRVPEPGRGRSELTRVVAECRLYLHELDEARTDPSTERRSRPRRSTDSLAARFVSGAWTGAVIVGSAALGLLETILETILGVMVAGLPSLSTVRRVVGSRLVWGVVASCLAVAVAVVIDNAATKQRRQAATIEQLASELRSLRDRSADDATWEAFTERARELLDRTIPELEESADAGDRVSIDLLWAARDFLPQMLKDARLEPSEAERQFDVCMRRVRITHEAARRRSSNWLHRD